MNTWFRRLFSREEPPEPQWLEEEYFELRRGHEVILIRPTYSEAYRALYELVLRDAPPNLSAVEVVDRVQASGLEITRYSRTDASQPFTPEPFPVVVMTTGSNQFEE